MLTENIPLADVSWNAKSLLWCCVRLQLVFARLKFIHFSSVLCICSYRNYFVTFASTREVWRASSMCRKMQIRHRIIETSTCIGMRRSAYKYYAFNRSNRVFNNIAIAWMMYIYLVYCDVSCNFSSNAFRWRRDVTTTEQAAGAGEPARRRRQIAPSGDIPWRCRGCYADAWHAKVGIWCDDRVQVARHRTVPTITYKQRLLCRWFGFISEIVL